MRVDFEWKKRPSQIAKEIINSDVQLFTANEAKSLMDPYVPARNLVLAQNVSVYTEDDQGIVEYRSPYAHYQYKGIVYGPNYPVKEGGVIIGWKSPPHKTPTNRKLEHSKRHPLATSHWDKAMVTARGDDLTAAVQRFIERGH